MHVPSSTSTSMASLALSLSSYAGENATTQGMSALLASHMTWVIDSRAYAHMTCTSSIINSYHPNSSLLDGHIVDGHPCPVKGFGTTHASSPYSFTMFFMFLDFLLISSQLVPSPKPLLVVSSSIIIIASSRIFVWEK